MQLGMLWIPDIFFQWIYKIVEQNNFIGIRAALQLQML